MKNSTGLGSRPHSFQATKTHCKWGHEFNEENTTWQNGVHRVCKTCARRRSALTAAKNRRSRPTAEQRFWSRVDKSGPVPDERPDLGSCWVRVGGNGQYGHGSLRVDGRRVKAHRFAYELMVGPIPDGLTLDHLCRNPPCVRPSHLEPVTHRENTDRGEGVTAHNRRKTHCGRGHVFDAANTMWSAGRYGRRTRRCRECHRETGRRSAQKRRVSAGLLDWSDVLALPSGKDDEVAS